MATAEQDADWIVKNQDKRGTPEFDTVAKAYQQVRAKAPLQQIEPAGVGDPTYGMSGAGKYMAGVGKGMTDIAQGVGQNLGLVSREQVAESRKYDAPLMATGAGRGGEIAGQIATALPTMFIPGANTVLGGAAIGAGLGLAQPSVSTGETLQNVGMGGAGGGVGVLAGRAIPKAIESFVAPFTRPGSEKVAGEVLRRFSEGSTDDVMRAAANPSQLVAGSKPTLAEVAQNPGISTLQQAVRGVSPTVNNALGQRATDNLVARTSALRGIAGTADDMAQAKGVRELMSESLYRAAEKAKVPVTIRDRAISEIMERPSLRAAWGQAEKLAQRGGLNDANVARDCGVSAKTVREYYQILDDTLLGHRLPPWRRARARRLIETEKYYLFDVGLVRALSGMRRLEPGSEEFGRAFEHLLIEEVRAYLSYREKDLPMTFWRTSTGYEVDLILGDLDLAVECKARAGVDGRDARGLRALREDQRVRRALIVSLVERRRTFEDGSEIGDLLVAELAEGDA